MDLHKLEIFAAVSELGNLSKAAVTLHTLPSVVSRQIAALEREWGGKLFYRTGRGMTLTELGQRVLPRVRATLQEYRSLQQEVRAQEGVISGEVRIGLVPSLAHAISVMLFRDLLQHYPGIKLQLLEGVTAQLDTWRMNDEVDITVLFRSGLAGLRDEESLGDIDTYLVGAVGDKVTAEPTVRFRELDGLPLVLASMPNGLRADVEKEAQRQGLALNIVLATSSLAIQTELAARGGAYTIMAGYAASQRMSAGLQASRIVEPNIVRKIALSMASHRPATIATRLVARQTRLHVEEALKTMPLRPR
jgi:LysR family transcriptional regulator, nitrogen assimilation regulatory protein